MTVQLELIDVAKTYRTGGVTVTALAPICATVSAGELVVISGPSGSGKSTLLGIVAMLVAPTSGRLVLDGRDVTGLSERERDLMRADRLAFVPQHPRLFGELTAVQNIEFAGRKRDRFRALALLKRVGLDHRVDHRAELLSGGEQQRLSVARALVSRARMVVADEPTSGLDDRNAAMVGGLLRSLCVDDGATVIVASHDSRIKAYGTRLIQLGAEVGA